jgi:hypothetical protein
MSGPLTIEDDKTATKRAAESFVYQFNYDEHLADSVELASVGTFTISPADGILTKDNPSLITGNRKVEVRLIGGKPGKTYVIEHTAVTNESPTQTPAKKFYLFIKP